MGIERAHRPTRLSQFQVSVDEELCRGLSIRFARTAAQDCCFGPVRGLQVPLLGAGGGYAPGAVAVQLRM